MGSPQLEDWRAGADHLHGGSDGKAEWLAALGWLLLLGTAMAAAVAIALTAGPKK